MGAEVSEERAVSIFRVKMRRDKLRLCYVGGEQNAFTKTRVGEEEKEPGPAFTIPFPARLWNLVNCCIMMHPYESNGLCCFRYHL